MAAHKQEVRSETGTGKRVKGLKLKSFICNNEGQDPLKSSVGTNRAGELTLEADSGQQVLVGGDCVQTLPVPQLPHLTGVITTSCRQVIPESSNNTDNIHIINTGPSVPPPLTDPEAGLDL